MWTMLGGRKSALALVAMALVAAQKPLGLDSDAVDQIIWLALGGGGLIALEDVASHFGKVKKKP